MAGPADHEIADIVLDPINSTCALFTALGFNGKVPPKIPAAILIVRTGGTIQLDGGYPVLRWLLIRGDWFYC